MCVCVHYHRERERAGRAADEVGRPCVGRMCVSSAARGELRREEGAAWRSLAELILERLRMVQVRVHRCVCVCVCVRVCVCVSVCVCVCEGSLSLSLSLCPLISSWLFPYLPSSTHTQVHALYTRTHARNASSADRLVATVATPVSPQFLTLLYTHAHTRTHTHTHTHTNTRFDYSSLLRLVFASLCTAGGD